MYQPLAGYKILDCSRLLPYQFCTCILGDLGAEVLKIEAPGEGDYGRWVDLQTPGKERLSFAMVNRNKKSMVLNLKKEKGKTILKRLAAEYDVLFETFRPGVMERLGLGYETIRKVNPRIIYCSGTGYGQTGPYRMKAGYDINYISIAGILSTTGRHTGRPVIPGVPFSDMAGGGVFPALSIMAALLGREKTGSGVYIDVAMTDVMASFNITNIAAELQRKIEKIPRKYTIDGASLCYNTYQTKDGKFVSIGNLEGKFWESFCKAIEREDLIDTHFAPYEDGEVLTETLKEIFAGKTRAEWVEVFRNVDTCFAPILTPEEVLDDEHLKQRGMVRRWKDPKRGEVLHLGFPALFSEELDYMRSEAPELGEHTTEVLTRLGYQQEEIQRLQEEGVV